MIVSDGTLEEMLTSGHLGIAPLDLSTQLQPASVDVRLGTSFQWFGGITGDWAIDPTKDNTRMARRVFVPVDDYFLLRPGEFALGCTAERLRLPNDLVARVEGKSSLARLGLAVHATAGFIDPGFEGQITLELSNLSPYSIKLRPGMKIAQLSFQFMDAPAKRPYGHKDLNSKYQGQEGATPSAYHLND